jgi:hypothetical protein
MMRARSVRDVPRLLEQEFKLVSAVTQRRPKSVFTTTTLLDACRDARMSIMGFVGFSQVAERLYRAGKYVPSKEGV